MDQSAAASYDDLANKQAVRCDLNKRNRLPSGLLTRAAVGRSGSWRSAPRSESMVGSSESIGAITGAQKAERPVDTRTVRMMSRSARGKKWITTAQPTLF